MHSWHDCVCCWKQIIDSIMALFRVDFCGRGELADRQQKLAQMLSRLQKLSEGERKEPLDFIKCRYQTASITHVTRSPFGSIWCQMIVNAKLALQIPEITLILLCLDYAILTINFCLCRIQCCNFYHKSGKKVIIYKDLNSSFSQHYLSQFSTNTIHVLDINEMCFFADDSWSWRLVLCLCLCSYSKPQMTQYLFYVRGTKHLSSFFYLPWTADLHGLTNSYNEVHLNKNFCFKHLKCCHCMLISTSELAKCLLLQFSSWS